MNKVVLIDDDLNILMILSEFLSEIDVVSKSFSDPVKAIEHIEKNSGNIDLIISDISMPEMNGIDLLTEIKKKYLTKHIPIMMFTAYSDSEILKKAMINGAVDFLMKPLERDYFVLKVQSYLKNFSQLKEHGKIIQQGKYKRNDLDHLIVVSNKNMSDGMLEILSDSEKEIGKNQFCSWYHFQNGVYKPREP
jgi:DNA-binding NtrC family response regulator